MILLKLAWMSWNIELVPRYTFKAKSNPRTLTAFCCILNVHRINAGTAFAFNKGLIYASKIYMILVRTSRFHLFVRQSNDDLNWSLINVKKCSLCFLGKKSKQIHFNKPGLLKEKDYKKKYTQICAKLSRCKHV